MRAAPGPQEERAADLAGEQHEQQVRRARESAAHAARCRFAVFLCPHVNAVSLLLNPAAQPLSSRGPSCLHRPRRHSVTQPSESGLLLKASGGSPVASRVQKLQHCQRAPAATQAEVPAVKRIHLQQALAPSAPGGTAPTAAQRRPRTEHCGQAACRWDISTIMHLHLFVLCRVPSGTGETTQCAARLHAL